MSLRKKKKRGRARDARRPRNTGAGTSHYYLILGTTGTGKTSLARLLYRQRIAASGRGVVVDPRGELSDLGELVDSPRAVYRQLREGKYRSLVIQPGWHADINDLWRPIFEAGHLLLFIDESHTVAKANRIDRDLERLIMTARTRRVDIIMTCHRLVDANGIYTGLLDVLCSFRQPKMHYADQIADQFFDGMHAERLSRLPDGEYLRADCNTGQFSHGKITLPGS